MKRYEYTTYACLMSLLFIGIGLFSSCSDEVAVDAGTTTDGLPFLSIVANVDAGMVTRATDDSATDNPAEDQRNTNGSWIKNLTVFLFSVDAADGATPLLTKTVQVQNNPSMTDQANKIEMAAQDLRKAGIEIGSHVAVYAIANQIPTDAKNMTKKQVLDLTGTLPQYKQTGAFYSLVPMTGSVSDYTITSTVSQTIPLNLKRAVIRIKIDIVDAEFDNDKYNSSQYYWKIESVKLYNDYATTYLWNEGIPTTPGCRTEANGIGITKDDFPTSNKYEAGTFYLNCNEASTAHATPDPIKIKVSGLRGNGNSVDTPFEYTVDLKRTDGTHVFERNTSITATLTLSAGSVTLILNDLVWSEGTDISSDEKPLNVEPKANCYIMKPGSSILIPVAQVQDAHTFQSNIAAIDASETLTADLVWTDVKGTSSQKGLADDASVADITMLGNGPEALIRVVAGSTAGNSVIAVKNADGTVKWSWHIWVTDYDPETTNTTYNSTTFMDRNLGALTNQPTNDGSNSNGVVGTYYQWGRPTPLQTKSMTSATSAAPATIYDAAGNTVTRESIPAGSNFGTITQSPGSFIVGPYTGTNAFWGSTGSIKTPLDPCPSGWRVPFKEAWTGIVFQNTNSSGIQTDAGFYPTSQAFTNVNTIGGAKSPFFWTATTYNTNKPYSYNGNSQDFTDMDDYFGLPIRCIKE